MIRSALAVLLVLLAVDAEAQPGAPLRPDRAEAPALTGDVRLDLLAAPDEAGPLGSGAFGREGYRNPALAFGLSAAVPGAGQAYNGSWIRAAAAAGIEIGLWAGYVTWRGRGLDGRDAYQAFAHQSWSPVRYAEWLNAYPGYGGPGLDVSMVAGIDFQNPSAWTDEERGRVLDFFEQIRAAERQSVYENADGSGTGATFSHVLEDFGEQQYYELIGKYFQYGPGWSDWCAGRDPDSPECFTIDGFADRDVFAGKTGLFFDYAEDHAEANTLLRRASRATSLVVLNHALAALDALLTARFHNRGLNVDTELSLVPDGRGGATPSASLRFQF